MEYIIKTNRRGQTRGQICTEKQRGRERKRQRLSDRESYIGEEEDRKT